MFNLSKFISSAVTSRPKSTCAPRTYDRARRRKTNVKDRYSVQALNENNDLRAKRLMEDRTMPIAA